MAQSDSYQIPMHSHGTFTSAATAVDVTVALGYRPGMVLFFGDTGATSPNIFIGIDSALSGAADKVLKITGTTGVVTVVTNAAGIAFSDTGFTVDSTTQANSGTNMWMCSRG